MILALSPELSLAAACCRWPLERNARNAIDDAIARGINWSLFERIVNRNRVLPLVANALTWADARLPAPLAYRFAERTQECARRSLVMARESLLLQRTFDEAGVPLMIVKGAPLAVLAYGDLGLKESWDIDLLVCPGDVVRAIGLLGDLGYRGPLTEIALRKLQAQVTYGKEAQLTRTAPSITAELHWRLTDNPRLLRDVGPVQRSQNVPISGGWLRTLPDEELLTYLCVHGTYHNWNRLKWLADFGAMIGDRTPQEIAHLYTVALTHGAGRCAAVALLLCRRLLGLSLDERMARELGGDRMARMLVQNAIAGLAHRRGVVEMRPYSWPWARTIAAHFLAAKGPAHKLEQLGILWNAPDYRSSAALPRSLEFAYHLIRLPLWFWRVSMRAVQRSRA